MLAAFIPDKLFKGYEADLKKILATPLKDPRDVSWMVHDKIIPLFEDFTKKLVELAPNARETLEYRRGVRVDMLQLLARTYDALDRAIVVPYPRVTPLDHTLAHIQMVADQRVTKLAPSLGKALKIEPAIDGAKAQVLARKALKKASPEVLEAITTEDWSNRTLDIKFRFFEANVDRAAARLVSVTKVETDFAGWFSFIRGVLLENYAGEPRYSEFDLHGMKVVIDDATVTPEEHDRYVKYLDAAYQLMKKKRLGRAWYGTVYIECDKCGGVNHNTGGGVGGHFNIEKDHVKIFSRPSSFIIELMAHELGHRYWFKDMTSTQRAKFTNLVKVRTRPKPKMEGYTPDLMSADVIDEVRRRVEGVTKKVREALRDFEKSRLKNYRAIIDKFEGTLSQVALEFNNDIFTAVQTKGGPSVSPLARKSWDSLLKAASDAYRHLFNVRVIEGRLNSYPDGPNDWDKIFKKERANWSAEATDFLNVAEVTAVHYVSECVVGYNAKEKTFADDAVKDWEAEQAAVDRPVLPVSDYGNSNIDEAFAEAFMFYVMDMKMNADQESSFKAVLWNKDRTATRVVDRWLSGPVN